MRSDPSGMGWVESTVAPREEEAPSLAILRLGWTEPPSLFTHRMRSGGWGTSRAAEQVAMGRRRWVRDAAAVSSLVAEEVEEEEVAIFGGREV